MRQMDQPAFQTAEEVFRNSIVVWISLPGHALTNAAFDQFVTVSFGSILHASVAVKNQVGVRSFPVNRHFQGRESQAGIDSVGECIAYNLSGTQILYNRQIKPAFLRGNVSDIAHPDLIGLRRVKVPHKKVWCNGAVMVGVCRGMVGPFPEGMNVVLLHQPVYASSPTYDSLPPKKMK